MRNRRIFLLECKKSGVHPNHITSRVTSLCGAITDETSAREVTDFNRKVIQNILKLEIKITIKKILRVERECSRLWEILEGSLPTHILIEFQRRQNIRYNYEFHNIKTTNLSKIDHLKSQQLNKLVTQTKWFRNVSSVQIPNDITQLLSLGPKFSIEIPKKEVSVQRILAEVENILSFDSYSDDNNRNILRARATNNITNYLLKAPVINNYYQKKFYEARKFLHDNPQILILPSDKGNVTVAMDKDRYDSLALDILRDEKYYAVLTRNPTTTIQNKSNEFVNEFKQKSYISDITAKKLHNYNSIPARFYGLPKIHKPTLSLRPIVSSINTPTTNLSIFVAEILSKSFNNETDRYFIKDSFDFAEKFNNFQLPQGYVIVSFDVVSLYSNIPLELAVKTIEERWDNISPHTNIPKGRFVALLRFLFNSVFFTHNGVIYKQIFGSPMGSNLSPSLARLVMDYILDKILDTLPFEMPFIKKYVDDIICSIPEDQVTSTFETFNRFNEHIKFTIESEDEDRSVPFLDTKVIRTSTNMVILDWYKKPTSSGRYVHFESSHPLRQKINLILEMKNRITKISHPTFIEKNLNLLKTTFIENGYPRYLVNSLIFNTQTNRDRNLRPGDEVDENNSNEQIVRYNTSLTNISGLTSKLADILRNDNIRIAYKNNFTLKKLFSKTKDKIPAENQRNVVYQIPCSSCDQVYVGQTCQQLKKRITQHRSDIKHPAKKCALAEHCRTLQHVMNFQEFKILEIEDNLKKRNFLEMYHIKRSNNAMNTKADLNDISNIYSFLFSLNPSDSTANIREPND